MLTVHTANICIGTRATFCQFPEPSRYGAPGVEFMGLHKENNAVLQIHFLPGQVSTCWGRDLPAAFLTLISLEGIVWQHGGGGVGTGGPGLLPSVHLEVHRPP